MGRLITLFIVVVLLHGCEEQQPLDLGSGYRLQYGDHGHVSIKEDSGGSVIDSRIIAYAQDASFIIVLQKPWEVIHEMNPHATRYDEWIDVFERSTYRQYWIIAKKEPRTYSYDTLTKSARYANVHGPYQRDEYVRMRSELGVPNNLRLEK
jgi:hypothetical protein